MDKQELIEKVARLEEDLLRLTSKYKMLRRRQFLHRGEITGEQADEMRNILSGHRIDAARMVDFEPSNFVFGEGHIDHGGLLWWLDVNEGKWVG